MIYRTYDAWKLATPWDDDEEPESITCPLCGVERDAHWEDDEYGGRLVADDACDCEDEEDEIDDPAPLRPFTVQYPEHEEDAFIKPRGTTMAPIHKMCDDIARSYKHTLGGVVPPSAD